MATSHAATQDSRPCFVCVALVFSVTAAVVAEEPATARADKSAFTISNPTPSAQLRDFNPDRPSVTQGPYTIDAGHFQAEFSFVEYTHDNGPRGAWADSYAALPTNLRVGLFNDLELSLAVSPYETIHTVGPRPSAGRGPARRASSTDAGFGDLQLTAKWNLWGNDGGKTAFAVMPFVRLPTGAPGLSSHHVEGGLILPVAVQELPAGFVLGAEIEFNVVRNDANDAYGVEFIHGVVLSHGLWAQGLNGYVEYVGIAPTNTGAAYLAYVNTGLTYAIGKNLEVDVGINMGASQHAADYTLFSGLSFRL